MNFRGRFSGEIGPRPDYFAHQSIDGRSRQRPRRQWPAQSRRTTCGRQDGRSCGTSTVWGLADGRSSKQRATAMGRTEPVGSAKGHRAHVTNRSSTHDGSAMHRSTPSRSVTSAGLSRRSRYQRRTTALSLKQNTSERCPSADLEFFPNLVRPKAAASQSQTRLLTCDMRGVVRLAGRCSLDGRVRSREPVRDLHPKRKYRFGFLRSEVLP